jgi:hypothetical protein
MSSSSSPALSLELPRSAWQWLPAGMLLLTSSIMPWLVLNAWQASVICLLGLCLAGLWLWQTGLTNPARRIKALHWQQNGQWLLQPLQGEAIAATLSTRSWVSPWVVCLKFFSPAGKRYQRMLWRSEFSASAWHQWQLRLALEGRAAKSELRELR